MICRQTTYVYIKNDATDQATLETVLGQFALAYSSITVGDQDRYLQYTVNTSTEELKEIIAKLSGMRIFVSTGQQISDFMAGATGTNPIDVAREETPIYRHANQSSNGSTTLYTVPAGKVLFISSMVVQAVQDPSASTTKGYGALSASDGTNSYLVYAEMHDTVPSPLSEVVVFDIPLKVAAAGTVALSFAKQVAGSGFISGSFNGWLEDA